MKKDRLAQHLKPRIIRSVDISARKPEPMFKIVRFAGSTNFEVYPEDMVRGWCQQMTIKFMTREAAENWLPFLNRKIYKKKCTNNNQRDRHARSYLT